jgi:hypothetical protein
MQYPQLLPQLLLLLLLEPLAAALMTGECEHARLEKWCTGLHP